jgi:hypothetical protein
LRSTLLEFAADTTKPGSWRARAALNYVYGTDMHFVYLTPPVEDSENAGRRMYDEPVEQAVPVTMDRVMSLGIYPNPADNSFMLHLTSPSDGRVYYAVTDMLGKVIVNGSCASNTKHEVSASLLPEGIYLLTISQDDAIVENRKLMIIK